MSSRRRRRVSGAYPGALILSPTTDTGFREYGSAGRLFLPASTNHYLNPSFELDTNADGCADQAAKQYGVTPVYTRVAGRLGGYAQRYQYTGQGGDAAAACALATRQLSGLSAGDKITASVYVKGTSSGLSRTELRLFSGATYVLVAYPQTNEWTRISGTLTIPVGSSVADIIPCYLEGIDTDDTVDVSIDDVLIEKVAVLTPYFDGSTHDCSWSEAANASTSVRAASDLQVTCPTGFHLASTVAMRAAPLWAGSSTGEYDLFASGTGSSSCFNIYRDPSNTRFGIYDGVTSSVGGNQNFAANTSHRFIGRMLNTGSMDLTTDGSTSTAVTSTLVRTQPTVAHIGKFIGGLFNATSYIGPVAICPARITDAETALLSTLLTSCNGAELYKWFYDRGYYGTMIIPLESDSTAYIVGGGSYRDNYTYTPVAATTDTGYEVYA